MKTILEIIRQQPAAIILILAGLAIRYLIGRRRFRRRGIGGTQHYTSYEHALLTSALEWLLDLLAILMIVAGIGWLI